MLVAHNKGNNKVIRTITTSKLHAAYCMHQRRPDATYRHGVALRRTNSTTATAVAVAAAAAAGCWVQFDASACCGNTQSRAATVPWCSLCTAFY